MKYPIQPVTISQQWDVAEIEYRIIDLIPGNSVTFSIGYIDTNGKYIDNPKLLYSTIVDGADYAQWGTSDGYIINLLMNRIQAVLTAAT